MKYLQIYLFLLIYIVNVSCLFKNKKSCSSNLYVLEASKKLKKNIRLSFSQKKLYQVNIPLKRQNKKSSIYYKNNRKKRMISSDPEAKWTFPIPYFIDSGVSHLLVDSALRMISRETCIRFKKYRKMISGMTGIRYYYGIGCNSAVGKQYEGVWQDISIGEGCNNTGRIQHETMHALGFYHTHSRYDRDNYIYFQLENAVEDKLQNFEKVLFEDSYTFGIPLDFGSVMMYGATEFSKNDQATILSYDCLYWNTYGLVDKISFGDAKMLNYLYCSKKCPKKLECMNGGYQDPNNCKKCKCVRGFIGPLCNMYSLPTRECGPSRLYATNTIKKHMISGPKNCIIHILTKNTHRVVIRILISFFFPNTQFICFTQNSVEIKYWNNKIPTGARFCLYQHNIMIYAYSSHVIIYFRSTQPQNYFYFLYKSVPKKFSPRYVESEFIEFQNLLP
uniref:Zinc metalloproteinase n=1 Tax=Strongyloides stercoralis TaxID=6248 RepID=A0A0K0ENP4_STRER